MAGGLCGLVDKGQSRRGGVDKSCGGWRDECPRLAAAKYVANSCILSGKHEAGMPARLAREENEALKARMSALEARLAQLTPVTGPAAELASTATVNIDRPGV